MAGMSEPEGQATQERNGEAPEEGSGRLSRSVLGLSIISGLNVLCLAFMIFHFAGRSDDPVAEAAEPSANAAMIGAESPRTAFGVFGNIDFAPMSELVVSVASGIDGASGDGSDQRAQDTTSPVRTARSSASADPSEEQDSQSWIQLAALSNMDTAERVWTDLKERHAALLSDRKPRYFGPDDVGGSLYHIRIGPMATGAAMGLCDELEAEGADCFCVRPKSKDMS